MNSVCRFLIAALFAFALHASAQTSQPGPESTNQNRNEPSIQIQGQAPAGTQLDQNPVSLTPAPQTPTGSPASAPATSTNTTATDKTAPAQKTTAPATDAGQPPAGGITGQQPSAEASSDGQPQTQILPGGDAPGSADPLLEPAPLPKGTATLVGGTAEKVDPVRNRVRLQPFGGGKRMDIRFDERSHFYRDGRETTILGIKKGDRIYADTMLVDGRIFARNLRVQTESGPAEARGQITSYDTATGSVTIQDQLTSQPVKFNVSNKTPVGRDNAATTIAELRPGTLIDVIFAAGGNSSDARRIDILALPGANYMFVGRLTNVDLRAGLLAVENQSDNKNYEIHFDPSKVDQRQQLVVGAEIAANTVFDGHRYTAQTLTVNTAANAQQ